MLANSEDPDQTSCFTMSDLGLHCLPMSHEKDAMLICVKSGTELANFMTKGKYTYIPAYVHLNV